MVPEGVLACFHPVNACFMPVACVKNRLMMILLIGVLHVCVCVSEVRMPLKYIMFSHYSLLTFSDFHMALGQSMGIRGNWDYVCTSQKDMQTLK